MATKKRSSRSSRPTRRSRPGRRFGNSDRHSNAVAVESILSPYVGTTHRVRLFFGNPDTGEVWNEENMVTGFLGRSRGAGPHPMKVLLLLPTKHSVGGHAISTGSVLRILLDGREIYRNPKYREPVYQLREGTTAGLPFEVWTNGEIDARFPSAAKRQRWLDFMNGLRSTK